MYVKPITYTDYDGIQHTEKFYFNISKAELIEMDATETGGLTKRLNEMVDSNEISDIFKRVKSIVLKAYGKKSADGKRFIKSPEMSQEFEQTEAYSELILEFMQNPKSFEEFLKGTLPKTDGSATVSADKVPNAIPMATAGV